LLRGCTHDRVRLEVCRGPIHPATGLLAAIVSALVFARSGFGDVLGRCRSYCRAATGSSLPEQASGRGGAHVAANERFRPPSVVESDERFGDNSPFRHPSVGVGAHDRLRLRHGMPVACGGSCRAAESGLREGRWQLMSRRTISRRPVGFSSPVARRSGSLRDPSADPRPAINEATAASARREHPRFQRRLSRAYSRSDDARPGRRRIGSGCFPGEGESLDQET
jgi:hypothetical protein